ncbi:MAG: protease modulator HflK, partial [Gammaproteobacteria bacterium]|nr:protease modulator HflK [Gammaproteobacteria bacterium]
NSNKVFIDAEGGGNLLYLPLDQLVRGSNRQLPGAETNRSSDTQTDDILTLEERDAEDSRTRTRREPR